jgi:hypothetical protein
MTKIEILRRLSHARYDLAMPYRQHFKVYYTELQHERFLSEDKTLALQWLPNGNNGSKGSVELWSVERSNKHNENN